MMSPAAPILILILAFSSQAGFAEIRGTIPEAALEICIRAPTAACVAEIALADARLISADKTLASYLIHANQTDLLKKHLSLEAKGDESFMNYVRIRSIAMYMVAALKGAATKNTTPDQINLQLRAYEEMLPPTFEVNSETVGRAEVYMVAAEYMLHGVPSAASLHKDFRIDHPKPALDEKRVESTYGHALEVFVQRWKELASRSGELMSFGTSMLDFNRKDDTRWAAQKLSHPPDTASFCRGAALWMQLNDLEKAEAATTGTRCYEQRAEVAKRFAQLRDATSARRIAYEVARDLPAYINQLRNILDGPRLIDTASPLINALALIGDRDRALAEIDALNQLVRHDGRLLSSFAGTSISLSDIASLLYSVGESDKADTLIEAEFKPDARYPWSEGFAVAFAMCEAGKRDCLDRLLTYSGQPLDYSSADAIYRWGLQNNKSEITPKYIEAKFGFADPFRLEYGKLSRETFSGDKDAEIKIIALLVAEERQRSDQLQLVRCIFLLRLAVAFENKILATDIAKLILFRASKIDEGLSAQAVTGDEEAANLKAYSSISGNRIMYLAEMAALIAQLP